MVGANNSVTIEALIEVVVVPQKFVVSVSLKSRPLFVHSAVEVPDNDVPLKCFWYIAY